jgi:hypothetical protein
MPLPDFVFCGLPVFGAGGLCLLDVFTSFIAFFALAGLLTSFIFFQLPRNRRSPLYILRL